MNLIINPEFESLYPPLSDERDGARAEADHAKSDQVRMAQDVAGMFNELRALAERQAALHTDPCIIKPSWSRFGMNWIAPARMPIYGVKRPTASAPASPICRPTPNIPSGRWHGSRRDWNRRGGRGGGGLSVGEFERHVTTLPVFFSGARTWSTRPLP